MQVTEIHREKNTFSVDVNLPGHAPRGAATPLFIRTRKVLIEREHGKCWLSGLTAEQLGGPLEAHHFPLERCFAEAIDWVRFSTDCKAGHWGPYAARFDWAAFFAATPFDAYTFVDDMTVNGRLLGKQFHTGKDEGVHMLPEPIWLAQKYMVEGYEFSDIEVIHHSQEN